MQQGSHIEIWRECSTIIENVIGAQMFERWFKPLKPLSLKDSVLTIEVPSDFYRKYIEEVYLNVLKKSLQRVIGPDARLIYRTSPVKVQPPMTFPAQNSAVPENKSISVNTYPAGAAPGPFVFPGLRRIQVNPRLNPVYCFSNLVN